MSRGLSDEGNDSTGTWITSADGKGKPRTQSCIPGAESSCVSLTLCMTSKGSIGSSESSRAQCTVVGHVGA
eukprot:1982760-Amphidinium_carterae.1